MKNLLLPTLLSIFAVISADAVPEDLLSKLDADEFATRSKAQKDLMNWAKGAEEDEIKELKKAYEETESPEVKTRLFDVLDNTTFMAVPNTRGFVGITMGQKPDGVGVTRVSPNTPAAKAGLKAGDIIIGLDKHDLTKMKGNEEEAMMFFSKYVKGKNAGERLDLKVKRGDKVMEKSLKLGNYDEYYRQFNIQPPMQGLRGAMGGGLQLQMNGQLLQLNGGQLKGGKLKIEMNGGQMLLNGKPLEAQPNDKPKLKAKAPIPELTPKPQAKKLKKKE